MGKIKQNSIIVFLGTFITILSGCTGVPSGIEPVTDFDAQRYMGVWYEIARFDHKFERGLTNVTAEYITIDNDSIAVINKGYNPFTEKWTTIRGVAQFMEDHKIGSLKVSFFWPFYAGYNIIELDRKNYQYVMVTGYSRSYLWILSRETTIEENILSKLLKKARSMGFNTTQLIYVDQFLNANHKIE